MRPKDGVIAELLVMMIRKNPERYTDSSATGLLLHKYNENIMIKRGITRAGTIY